ncbi:dienelactone hydrolase-related enzyme, partial [Rhizobium leguminosarum]|nr:dienelactone hydrolase-related enzyme [Rhizobium leguminosarum]
MYHKWLDHWDEQRARRGEEAKKTTAFVLDSCLAFPGEKRVGTIEEFCALADQALADSSFYDEPSESDDGFALQNGWLKFPSDISTDVEENNFVWAKVTESGSRNQALVIFHHWNATRRNYQIAKYFSQRGITTVEIAMPYHFERSRPGSLYAEDMLSSDLGRTIQSLR